MAPRAVRSTYKVYIGALMLFIAGATIAPPHPASLLEERSLHFCSSLGDRLPCDQAPPGPARRSRPRTPATLRRLPPHKCSSAVACSSAHAPGVTRRGRTNPLAPPSRAWAAAAPRGRGPRRRPTHGPGRCCAGRRNVEAHLPRRGLRHLLAGSPPSPPPTHPALPPPSSAARLLGPASSAPQLLRSPAPPPRRSSAPSSSRDASRSTSSTSRRPRSARSAPAGLPC